MRSGFRTALPRRSTRHCSMKAAIIARSAPCTGFWPTRVRRASVTNRLVYVGGWMVADGESSELAKRLIGDTCGKQEIEPGKLTIHADRGSSMTSKPVAFLMADLGITKTHSRPHVSDDNPYSESHFRTLKY